MQHITWFRAQINVTHFCKQEFAALKIEHFAFSYILSRLTIPPKSSQTYFDCKLMAPAIQFMTRVEQYFDSSSSVSEFTVPAIYKYFACLPVSVEYHLLY